MTYGEFLLQILDSSTDVVTAAYNTGFEAGKKYERDFRVCEPQSKRRFYRGRAVC